MGNWLIKPLPHRPEFVAEFLRVQAAVAAQEARQELDGDLQLLLQLRLQFVDLKIVCAKVGSRAGSAATVLKFDWLALLAAEPSCLFVLKPLQYWRDKTRDMAGYHEKEMNGWMLIPAQTCTMKPYICEGGLLAHQRPAAWRRTQESFFCRLLALLEEERSALQEGRLVSASPLPALDEVPHTLPVDPSPAPCWMCSKYIAKVSGWDKCWPVHESGGRQIPAMSAGQPTEGLMAHHLSERFCSCPCPAPILCCCIPPFL
jgi:hypothetical protein